MSVTIMKEIPLTKLSVWEGNVRKTGTEAGLDELAASIAAHGLLNPLTVGSGPKGRFVVIAGQRRLLALKMLAKAGTIPKTAPVACVLRDEEDDPSELSLAENVVRVAMHPADQFVAWRGLIDGGATTDSVAARFGVAESTVRRRMTLARVSPRIFGFYREGDIGLEALQAFTVSDDHAVQDAVWDRMSEWQRDDARAIRAMLTEGEVASQDKRAQFVGIAAYEAAGGIVRRDLFDPKDGGFFQDAALLDRLAQDKLDAAAAEVEAEGWKWAEGRMRFDWSDREEFEQADAEFATDEDDESAALWSPEVKAMAGAVVYLSYGGSVEIMRGLIRAADAGADGSGDDTDGDAQEDEVEEDAAPALPASLVEDLTAHRTAALRIELARSPDTALALVVHSLATSAFYPHGSSVLKAWITRRSLRTAMKDHDSDPAIMALNDERDRIGEVLPGDHAALWEWCLHADRSQLLDVLAVAAASGIDAVATKQDANRAGCEQGQALSAALNLDMAGWYRPTASGYFSRISKAAILSDLEAARQAPCAPSWEKLKKAELAALAEREVAATGWLPEPLR